MISGDSEVPQSEFVAAQQMGSFRKPHFSRISADVCYSPILGVILPSCALMTQDVDLATASLAFEGDSETGPMLDLLKRADQTFTPFPVLKKALHRHRSSRARDLLWIF